VVVLIACTMRAERLHVYGNPLETSPYLDGLAAGGAIFRRAMTNAPWTKPAIAALTSGRLPLVLGIDDPGPSVNTDRGLAPEVMTLAERFRGAGWATVGATANPNANEIFGFAQGFDQYHEASGLWRDEFKKVPGEDVVAAWLAHAAEVEGPLFGQIIVVDTHAPLVEYRARRLKLGLPLTKPTKLEHYDAAVNALDDVARALDEGLAKLGRSSRLLAFVGDHGEGLRAPKHAGIAHGRYLYEPTVHIPWILNGPGVPPGAQVESLTASVDVAPTLLTLAGLPLTDDLDGVSQLPVLQGAPPASPQRVFTETRFGNEHKGRFTTPEWVFIQNFDKGKSGWPRGRQELYAVGDRYQDQNVVGDNQAAAERFGAEMKALRAELEARALSWERGQSADDEDVRRALEALGYVEGGEGAPPEK